MSVVFMALSLRALGDGIGLSSFVVAGTELVDASRAPGELIIGEDGSGYDGQYYYRLSLDPFTDQRVDFGISLDQPGYRQQRILLPLLAYSLGRLTGISTLIWLPLINLLAIGLATASAERLLTRAGANPWWAVAVGVSPGLLLAARLDLAEPLAMALALTGLALCRTRPLLAGSALVLAVLARETTIVIAAGIGLVAVVEAWRSLRQDKTIEGSYVSRMTAALAPLMALVAWQAWLSSNWQEPALGYTADRVDAPVTAVLRSVVYVRTSLEAPPIVEWSWWVLRVGLLVLLVLALLGLRRSQVVTEAKSAFVVSLLVVATLPTLTTPQMSARATAEAVVLATLVLATLPGRLSRAALVAPVMTLLAFAATP